MVQPLAPNRPPPRSPKRAPVRWVPIALSAVALLAIAALVFVFGVLPVLLKQRCVDAAASQGVTLTLDHVAIGVGEVRLMNATLALDGVPQLKATAENVQVVLDGLTPGAATLNEVSLTLDGPLEEIEKALVTWSAARPRTSTATEAATAPPVTLTLGHFTWTRAFGAAAKIEMLDVGGDIDSAKGVSHLASSKVTVTSGQGSFGPWGLAMDRDPQTARVDIELDPVVKGGPSALFVRDASGASSVKVNVTSSPLSRLGIPAKAVGLASDSAIEGAIDFEEARTGAATLNGDVSITRAVFAGAPVDVKLALTAAGDATKGLDVKQGTLAAGPLHASLSGMMRIFEDGVRLALAWRSTPVACADLAREMGARQTGPLGGAGLGTLAQDLGEAVGIRVAGEATASGLITLDSRDANAASFTMTTNQTCGLALF